MKKLLFVLSLLLCLFLVPVTAAAQQWIDGALTTNPATNAIILESPVMTQSEYHSWNIICASTVSVVLAQEWRDSTNSNSLHSQYIILSTNATALLPFNFAMPLLMSNGERIRLRVNTGVTGSMQCSFIWQ